MESIYADIAARTGGNVYIGVVGPVRTGKSTLIKRIMETLVIPAITDPYRAQRARDELPQSASGRTIMTAEPKFVPEEAVEITPDGKTSLRLRMIDSVGYMIPGAVGADEEGVPRMVSTPWQETPIPMTEAAELGTKKVMEDHCSIGLVVTTDGSVTDIPRGDYAEAEGRAIRDMQATGKPFLVVVNTRNPGSEESGAVQNELRSRYGVESVAADCQALTKEGIAQLLEQLLYSFPLRQVLVYLPRWLDALEADHPLKAALYPALQKKAAEIASLAQAEKKVLLVDFDSQGNMSSGVGLSKEKPTIYELMAEQATAEQTIKKTPVANLDAIPASIDLSGAAIELVDQEDREFYLKKVLEPLRDKYDYILIDCPPSLGILTLNGLAAADAVLVPMQCEYFALEGISLLLQTVKKVQKTINPNLVIGGIFFTMYDSRTRLAHEVVSQVKAYFKDSVFNTIIPRNVRLSEAPSHGLPISMYDTACLGARSYKQLAAEVIARG